MLKKHISQYTDEELEAWLQQLVDDEAPNKVTEHLSTELAEIDKLVKAILA